MPKFVVHKSGMYSMPDISGIGKLASGMGTCPTYMAECRAVLRSRLKTAPTEYINLTPYIS
ncbi:MAG: hypothetical protein ACXWUF_16575 [Methylomagnum sp.]